MVIYPELALNGGAAGDDTLNMDDRWCFNINIKGRSWLGGIDRLRGRRLESSKKRCFLCFCSFISPTREMKEEKLEHELMAKHRQCQR